MAEQQGSPQNPILDPHPTDEVPDQSLAPAAVETAESLKRLIACPLPSSEQPAPTPAPQAQPLPQTPVTEGMQQTLAVEGIPPSDGSQPASNEQDKSKSTLSKDPPSYNVKKRRKDKDSKQRERFSSQNEWASTFFKWNGERERFVCDAPIKTSGQSDSDCEFKCKHSGFEAGTKRSNMVVHLQKVHALDMPSYLQERSRGHKSNSAGPSKASHSSSTKSPSTVPSTQNVIQPQTANQIHANIGDMPRNNAYFEVNVYKQDFKFHAAHFVAYQGYRERLHGHNYSVRVKLRGTNTIGHDGYVLDYSVIKRVTRKICKELNEHFLCPMLSDVITITKVVNTDNKNESNIKLSCEDGTMFQFPLSDCALLPLVHATTEELAIYLWGRILKDLDPTEMLNRGIFNLEVTIGEAIGQESVFSMNIPNVGESLLSSDCNDHCCNEEYNPGMFCVKNYIRGLRPCGCHSMYAE